MSKTVGYTRVSSKCQKDNNSIEQQIAEITARYTQVKIYEEQFTGKTTDRPVFNKVLSNLKEGDTLVVTKLDRLCRATKEGLEIIDKLIKQNIKIHILNMGLIEDTPMGRLIVTNLLAFAEFERAMIVERTQTGKAIAKTKAGFKEGRPPKFTKAQLNAAVVKLNALGGDLSYKEVEKEYKISKSSLVREVRRRKALEEIKNI